MFESSCITARRGQLARIGPIAALLLAGAASAQTFPSKPVRLVAPTAAGGNADIVARIAAEGMGRHLGQPVVVENQPGGRQIPASLMVSRGIADGYTLLLAGSVMSINTTLYKLPFDPLRDFQPVGMIGWTPVMLVAWPGLPVSNMKELIALAKAKPGTINYASAGPGSPAHLAGELLNVMTGIKLVQIPYKATAQGNTDTITGQVQLSFPGPSSVVSFIKSGKLKALGIASAQRTPQMPDVPSIAETVPGYEMAQWNAVMAATAVPRPAIARLNESIVKGISMPDLKAKFTSLGVDIQPGTPEALGAYFEAEIKKYARVIREANIKAEDD